jgi:phage-related protein
MTILIGFINGIADKLPDLIDAAFHLVIAFITGIGDALVENAKELRGAIDHLCWSILDAICEFFGINSPSTVMRDIGGYLIDGLIEGLGNGIVFVGNKMAEIGNAIKDKIKEFYDKYIAAGVTVVKKIIKGIGNKAVDLYKSVSSTVRSGIEAIKNIYKWIVRKGESIINAIVDGLTNAKDWIKDKLVGDDGIITKALNALGGLWDSLVGIGENIVNGLIEGITAAPDAIINAILEVCGPLADVVKEFFDIESPSKVMMKIGEYITEGLAIGIADKGDMATAAITNVSDDVVDGLGGLSSKIADIVNADTDFNPTITPVVDLSNVSASSAAIDSMLNTDRTLALAGNANMQMNSKISADVSNKKLNVDNSDVINELKSLRNDMNAMTETLTQMSIIMDTGALVGSLSRPMDNALGRRATLRRRGV